VQASSAAPRSRSASDRRCSFSGRPSGCPASEASTSAARLRAPTTESWYGSPTGRERRSPRARAVRLPLPPLRGEDIDRRLQRSRNRRRCNRAYQLHPRPNLGRAPRRRARPRSPLPRRRRRGPPRRLLPQRRSAVARRSRSRRRTFRSPSNCRRCRFKYRRHRFRRSRRRCPRLSPRSSRT